MRLFGLIFTGLLLTSCLEKEDVEYRIFYKHSLGQTETPVYDTLKINRRTKILKGLSVLENIYNWDRAIEQSDYSDSVAIHDGNLILVDRPIQGTLNGVSYNIYQYFVLHKKSGTAPMGVHVAGIGTVYFVPWDSHESIRLNHVIRGNQIQKCSEFANYIEDFLVPEIPDRPTIESDELEGEVLIDLD